MTGPASSRLPVWPPGLPRPERRDRWPAQRIAVGVGAPLLLLLALGRADLTVYAAFGAFTGIYGRGEPLGERARHQALAGLLLVTCVGLGVLTAGSASPWTVMWVGALVAAFGAVLATVWHLRPAGSLFFVFAVGTVGALPHPAPLPLALAVSGGAAALSVALGALGAWHSTRARPHELAAPPPHDQQPSELMSAGLRFFVAVGLAGALGLLSGLGHVAWAMVSAAVPMTALNQRMRVQRSLHRVAGTALGLGLSAVLLWPTLPGWGTVLVVMVLQWLAELFVARHYGLTMVFVTPLALLMNQLAHRVPPGELLLSRAAETVIGSLVGVLVVLATRPRRER
ncbi:FUSC family protein [Deinococcus radiodurans]|uniref:FUSC family protein n=1 Tax=Deinococcus radiodurans TaxID=1299 RepID=UPI00068CDBB3|nr:FUSC family protein [Deinococcus radiodurans]ANC72670.1 hypothetical protein A2G07_02555 [Deinococcus radiodurans R1 = ATCC 13939 = DSM 20539]QIP27903.1 FUSC family protein [Deinococcus radiodurans]QIP31217.1 FUSC family protein [Deinococcus radiodurans]UID71169.1 hypothetical protein DRO_2178 [Deinococcus radiodurans R1 = ATCC 13939 = DSM 20539]